MPLHNVSSSQKPGDHWDQTLAANISLTQGTLLNLQTKALWLYTLQIPANVHICRLLRRVALIFVALSWCEWFEEIGTDLNSNRITVHDTTLILRPSVRSRGWMQGEVSCEGWGQRSTYGVYTGLMAQTHVCPLPSSVFVHRCTVFCQRAQRSRRWLTRTRLSAVTQTVPDFEFSWMLLCQKNNFFCSAACNGSHHFVLMQSSK